MGLTCVYIYVFSCVIVDFCSKLVDKHIPVQTWMLWVDPIFLEKISFKMD